MEKNFKKKNQILRLVLPIIFMVVSIIEYLYVPNFDKSYLASPIYLYFLMSLLGIYLLSLVFSKRSKSLRKKLVYRGPLISFIFIVLTIYDLLTLKFQILALPYFAWVDMIFNSMLVDLGFLFESLVNSLKLLFTGFFIGSLVGILTGILAGYSKKINYWIDPLLKLLGPIPTTTWIPVVMVLASSLFSGAVFIIALGVYFQTTLATMTGIKNVDKSYYEVAKTLGARESELIRKISIPSATPNIFQGLISAMSSACTSLVVAEMLE